MNGTRSELFEKLIEKIDESYDLMSEYDSLPHNYGSGEYLYQSESQIIHGHQNPKTKLGDPRLDQLL